MPRTALVRSMQHFQAMVWLNHDPSRQITMEMAGLTLAVIPRVLPNGALITPQTDSAFGTKLCLVMAVRKIGKLLPTTTVIFAQTSASTPSLKGDGILTMRGMALVHGTSLWPDMASL